jgi:hypothetical protein
MKLTNVCQCEDEMSSACVLQQRWSAWLCVLACECQTGVHGYGCALSRGKTSACHTHAKPNLSPVRLFSKTLLFFWLAKTLGCRYLSFLRGVVDSDSLPLNVNREMLQVNICNNDDNTYQNNYYSRNIDCNPIGERQPVPRRPPRDAAGE